MSTCICHIIMKPHILILSTIITLTSCAVQHQVIAPSSTGLVDTMYFNAKDSLYYGYFENLLEQSTNKRLRRWAKRKSYQIIGFQVINASSNFTKGYQLKFYQDNQRIIPVRNEWIAHKARQKTNNVAFIAIPVSIILHAMFDSKDDQFDLACKDELFETLPMEISSANNEVRKASNKKLTEELTALDISDKVLQKDSPVYGIVIFKGNVDFNKLQVRR